MKLLEFALGLGVVALIVLACASVGVIESLIH